MEEYEQQRVSVCYVDGSTECVGLMLGKLRELVGRQITTVYTYPPANSNLGEELSYYGLRAKTNIRVFEISLDEEIV
ncbi:MAG: hypothetical protein KGI38_06045 [Thaumarchaeota archaeon]|nr:hypothetical protein [Nitrososphaerota archaeon]